VLPESQAISVGESPTRPDARQEPPPRLKAHLPGFQGGQQGGGAQNSSSTSSSCSRCRTSAEPCRTSARRFGVSEPPFDGAEPAFAEPAEPVGVSLYISQHALP